MSTNFLEKIDVENSVCISIHVLHFELTSGFLVSVGNLSIIFDQVRRFANGATSLVH